MIHHHSSDTLRRTKLVATLGPATSSHERLQQLVAAGVDVVRINCSHGVLEGHAAVIALVREVSEQQQRHIAVLVDLQGPKIRITSFEEGAITLVKGQEFTLDAEMDAAAGHQAAVGIGYQNLAQDVQAGDVLLLDDGRIRLSVSRIEGSRVICTVLLGGNLSNHKGVNRLGGGLTAPALTDKDKKDLAFMLQHDIDYIAVSFPRDANDIVLARRLLGEQGKHIGIIAKIERAEAVKSLEGIINESDGVMVARGDLAVEIGDEHVPLVQRDIIEKTRDMNKPVIIATQMMESMIHSPTPTRAEVSDIATAVLDNADAVMLSAETATGDFPIVTLQSMSNICQTVERYPASQQSRHRVTEQFQRIDEAIAMATMYTANHLDITAIVTLTETGATPRWMSRIRTAIPIYALSRYGKTLHKMALFRGVYPVEFDPTQHPYECVNRAALQCLVDADILKDRDRVILTKGDHMGVGGGSNAMKILLVGDVLAGI